MRTYVCPSCLIARYVRRCFHVSHPETDSWDPSASHRSTRLDRPYMDRMPPSIHLDDSYACIMFMCHSILSYLLGIHRSIGFLCLRKLLLHFLPFGKKKKLRKMHGRGQIKGKCMIHYSCTMLFFLHAVCRRSQLLQLLGLPKEKYGPINRPAFLGPPVDCVRSPHFLLT